MMISKKWLLACTFIAASLSGTAQAQLMPRFGVKAGLGLAKMTGDITGSKFGTGFGFGGTLILDMMPVSLVTDLYLARRVYGGTPYATKAWDLVIPVQARFNIMPMFYVQGGAFLSFGMGSQTVDDGINPPQSYDYANTTFGRTDFGLVFGAGASFPMGVGSLEVEGRFNWGLKDRNKLEVQSIKTMGMDLLVGFVF
ncbi:MAG TPA: outer membrane beta-barrel protein [Bdellovibrionota bacterium]|jgi:hypothetical protein|nr:outer membrane beta-barrel protein [Bdellovibrionota bacterium]